MGGKDPDWDDIFVNDPQEQVDKCASEIYGVFTSLMSGEALMWEWLCGVEQTV